MDNTDKIVVFVEECRSMGLSLKLPDVNEGQYMFTVNDSDEIIYGLGAIKGLLRHCLSLSAEQCQPRVRAILYRDVGVMLAGGKGEGLRFLKKQKLWFRL